MRGRRGQRGSQGNGQRGGQGNGQRGKKPSKETTETMSRPEDDVGTSMANLLLSEDSNPLALPPEESSMSTPEEVMELPNGTLVLITDPNNPAEQSPNRSYGPIRQVHLSQPLPQGRGYWISIDGIISILEGSGGSLENGSQLWRGDLSQIFPPDFAGTPRILLKTLKYTGMPITPEDRPEVRRTRSRLFQYGTVSKRIERMVQFCTSCKSQCCRKSVRSIGTQAGGSSNDSERCMFVKNVMARLGFCDPIKTFVVCTPIQGTLYELKLQSPNDDHLLRPGCAETSLGRDLRRVDTPPYLPSYLEEVVLPRIITPKSSSPSTSKMKHRTDSAAAKRREPSVRRHLKPKLDPPPHVPTRPRLITPESSSTSSMIEEKHKKYPQEQHPRATLGIRPGDKYLQSYSTNSTTFERVVTPTSVKSLPLPGAKQGVKMKEKTHTYPISSTRQVARPCRGNTGQTPATRLGLRLRGTWDSATTISSSNLRSHEIPAPESRAVQTSPHLIQDTRTYQEQATQTTPSLRRIRRRRSCSPRIRYDTQLDTRRDSVTEMGGSEQHEGEPRTPSPDISSRTSTTLQGQETTESETLREHL